MSDEDRIISMVGRDLKNRFPARNVVGNKILVKNWTVYHPL